MEEKTFLLIDNDGNVQAKVVTSDPTMETDSTLTKVEILETEAVKDLLLQPEIHRVKLDSEGKFLDFEKKEVPLEIPKIKEKKNRLSDIYRRLEIIEERLGVNNE